MADVQASASKSASDAAQTLSDKLLDSWSDSRKDSSHIFEIADTNLSDRDKAMGRRERYQGSSGQ
jgi:hypothetical protein